MKSKIIVQEKGTDEISASALQYKTLFDEAPYATIITDKYGHVAEVNNKLCKMFGYRRDELIGINITDLMDPEHTDITHLLSGSEVLTTKKLMRKKDGTVFNAETTIKTLSDNRVFFTIHDTTLRKQGENTFHSAEEKIRFTIDTIPTMAWTVQPNGTVDFANQRWIDYAGKDAFQNPNGIVHPDDLPRILNVWKMNKESGKYFEHEVRMKGVDGQYRWFMVRVAPFRNEGGKLVKWYGISIDIEDSKQAEHKLRLAYQRLTYLVENTPLATIEFDKDLFIKRWSARAEEIFGWSAEEAVGKNIHDFSFIYHEDIELVNEFTKRLLNGIPQGNVILHRNYTKDQKVIYCEWYNSTLRDEFGNIISILSLMHNVTERTLAEKAMKRSYLQIRRLTDHLHNIREEERTHIAREIHDELGGLLTVLKMDASWLNQKLESAETPVRQRIKNHMSMLDTMLESVRRISSQLRPSLLDNAGLIPTMEWQLKEFEKRFSIKTIFNKPDEGSQIPDPIKNGLFRIFQESLTNVARHANAKTVKIELLQKSGQLILNIKDDGQGFDKQKVAKKATLGILGMKERTTMLGGSYHIRTATGKGTNVTVILPCKP